MNIKLLTSTLAKIPVMDLLGSIIGAMDKPPTPNEREKKMQKGGYSFTQCYRSVHIRCFIYSREKIHVTACIYMYVYTPIVYIHVHNVAVHVHEYKYVYVAVLYRGMYIHVHVLYMYTCTCTCSVHSVCAHVHV